MVYDAGPEAHEVVEAASVMFLHDNALNTVAFEPGRDPIRGRRRHCELFHGAPAASGFMTSGGTKAF